MAPEKAPETERLRTEQALDEILRASQIRWLLPVEILEIFKNYQKLGILISEPHEKPPSGSFFIIKRHLLRQFRKDGHNWEKKKDGKNVQEAHEKLKVAGAVLFQCYYAHGEENEDFQRRIYWMLQGEPSDIVVVHYLQAKRNRKRSERGKEIMGELPTSSFNSQQHDFQILDPASNFDSIRSGSLHIRFEEMLCLKSVRPNPSYLNEVLRLSSILKPLLEEEEEDDMEQMLRLFSELKISTVKEKLCQKILKKKLHAWLLQKVIEGGSGLTELDVGGQGVLHFAAALGYDWALHAIVAANIDINYRDVNGWTPLHWAAYFNRLETVTLLTYYNADIEAQSSHPYGITPAALAAHVGLTDIADFLNSVKSEASYRYELLALGAGTDDNKMF